MGIDGGERKILSARVVRTIQSIKEIVKDHSDADIYVALQETNMDPNETAQKLLNQDPFHEVRRKKDKKKDMSFFQNSGYRGSTEARKPIEHVDQNIISNDIDHGVPRGGYSRNVVVRSREFRVVRDNRIKKNVSTEVKPPPLKSSTSTSDQRSTHVSVKGSNVVNKKSSDGNYLPRQAPIVKPAPHTVVPQVHELKVNNPELHSVPAPTNSVVGVYSSSSDPVHVPSDSKSVAKVGAIKRELGAVGVRHQTQENSTVKPSSLQNYSISDSHLVRNGTSSGGSSKSFSANSTSDQPSKTFQLDSVLPGVSGSRPSSSYKYNIRSRQQAGHQKASQPAKEWKRKSDPKLNANSHGATGSQTKSVSRSSDSSKDLETEAAHVRDKLEQIDIHHNQNVFIAENIRVSDSDRSRLTFGSFGTDDEYSKTTASGSLTVRAGENPTTGVSISLPNFVPKSPTIETSPSKLVDLADVQLRNSDSDSPSGRSSENLLPDKKDASSPQNLDNYADIGLTHGNSPSFTHTESQQQQEPAEFSSLPVYDSQTGYNIPYYRQLMDEPIRAQGGVQSPHETLGSHMTSNIPMSSISMVQQQPMPQMYQQLHHVSPFTNLMPYRQIISPVYGPPIPMTGYSGNPTYPQPSNGNSFFVMPGGSSHIGANNVKYGIQPFKPVPSGGSSGFGNFASPTGYAINAPGVLGGAAGLEESSRLKHKDGNLYLSNPQGETSEMWIQNPREMPNLQSASYYNMAGQTPHGAYMPPHSGHTSFNVAAQSSHMQFPGLYHPSPQASGLANPHHLGSAMGGGGANVAAVAAPGTQLGAYQQPQMSHLNWNANF